MDDLSSAGNELGDQVARTESPPHHPGSGLYSSTGLGERVGGPVLRLVQRRTLQ
jgi:hypothetical protein